MISLPQKSYSLLKIILKEHRPDLIYIIDNNDFNEEIYNDLRDVVLNELLQKGFDKNYTPTEYGFELENLIDEIGRLFL